MLLCLRKPSATVPTEGLSRGETSGTSSLKQQRQGSGTVKGPGQEYHEGEGSQGSSIPLALGWNRAGSPQRTFHSENLTRFLSPSVPAWGLGCFSANMHSMAQTRNQGPAPQGPHQASEA